VSDDRRDRYVPKHPTPRGVPAFVEEEATGRYEGEDLKRIRAKRKTDERVARLEDKHDALAETVTEIRVDVGEMRAEVRTLVKHVEAALVEQHQTERVRINGRTQIIAGAIGAIGVIAGAIATVIAGGCS
jgi:uncharacterized coiled-coil protein SlyX